MTTKPTADKVEREARLRWVPIEKMKVSPVAQRDLNQARVDRLAAEFDLELIGTPTMNERAGEFFILDGQHRIEALKQIGYGDQQVQCWVYVDLTDEQMAEQFLRLNDVLVVSAYDRFTKAVHAGREVECDINRIVRSHGLVVTRDSLEGAVSAVGTLTKVYRRGGPKVLSRTLQIITKSFGDSGLEATVLDGIGFLCQRYNGELDTSAAIERLGKINGGANGLLGKAEVMRRSTGEPKGQCVAAAAVEAINSGRGGKKLPSWWKDAK